MMYAIPPEVWGHHLQSHRGTPHQLWGVLKRRNRLCLSKIRASDAADLLTQKGEVMGHLPVNQSTELTGLPPSLSGCPHSAR